MPSSRPIGVFDSGIGGLTVARAIRDQLPHEDIIYYGDTMHLPYGEKSPEAIQRYSREIAQFLLQRNVKLIVIACNSASATAYISTRDFVGDRATVINVIDPMCNLVAERFAGQKVGVIGTKATIGAGIYQEKLADKVGLSAMATPLMAAMIEEGFVDDAVSRAVLNSYLSRPEMQNLQALILGCTHYPMLQNQLEQWYQGKTEILNAASAVADTCLKTLMQNDQLNPYDKPGTTRFFVSDYTPFFEHIARFFFGEEIELEEAGKI